MNNFIQTLELSLKKGFIDHNIQSAGSYRPKLLVNNEKKSEAILSSLLEELDHCESFLFSVAFITESGLAMIKSHLLDLKRKGIKGRILTSTFLNFNKPKLFRELMKLENVEVRLTNIAGFHSKGYIFKQKSHYSMIVGSSNLTANALKKNYEWNIKLTSYENGEIIHHFKNQFEEVWDSADILTEDWIHAYEQIYQPIINSNLTSKVADFPAIYNVNPIEQALKIIPNKMQEAALAQIRAIRVAGKNKGLVISATGTGKTYLSAFDVRQFAPKRMLFIVHREQILTKAKSDYQKILGGSDADFGILSGSNKKIEAKYLFATVQTISKLEVLNKFDRKAFDYILIDEVHKAGAQSYQKVIDYFDPRFLLGMTATPERTDDFNIYELFDYNIAYEIRLQEALEEDMLCPFHYFGVTDLEIEGELIDDTTVLAKLVTEDRINHILEKISYYGYSGDCVKGLIFCSRKEEAYQLSLELNNKGFRTFALTGVHSQEERELQVRRLEDGELDYLITVDIFNEGIDIPCINQVVMLRQTQSSIIFIQQLGRGLRKHDSKEYVTIIDFIGNYKNNYLIPIALSGDQSRNKDTIRRHTNNTSYVKGISTINFEEIAKKQIFKAINSSNLTELKKLRESYVALKNRIGRIPYLYDFLVNRSIDPEVICNTKKYPNYHEFLIKMKEEVPILTSYESKVLSMFSLELLNGKRIHEIILLEQLVNNEKIEYAKYTDCLKAINCTSDDETIMSVCRIFDLSFFVKDDQKKYGEQPIIYLSEEQIFSLSSEIINSIKKSTYFKEIILDIIKAAKEKNKKYSCNKPFTVNEKYSRKDACRLLNWHNDEKGTMYGYKPKYNTCPIFITYHKNDDVEDSIKYEDEFLDQENLKWFTRSKRTLESEEVQKIIQAEENNTGIYIFVKKDNDEGSDFYYLGQALPDKNTIRQEAMRGQNNKEIPVVTMNMVMEAPVEYDLYHYLVEGSEI